MDKEPDETHTFTANNFRDDVQTARITVNGAPEDAWIRYNLTAIKGGVPLFGFSPDTLQRFRGTASAHFANVLGSVDQVFQTVKVSHNGRQTTRFRAVSANAFKPNDSWAFSDFLSLPDVERISLQQDSRLVVHADGFGSGNVWAAYRVWTISGGDSPKYIYWRAYTPTRSSLSDLRFTYPKLPDALNAHMPDIGLDYVSVRISGADYNLLDNTFRTQGRRRSAYKTIKDNLTSTSAQTLGLDEPEIQFYTHEQVDW